MTTRPTDVWRIIEQPRARDGDSIYLVREREIERDEREVFVRRDAKPVLCRLTWLACPEISGPRADPVNGPRATADAQLWLDTRWGTEMTAVQYGFEKYGRPLVDLRSGDDSLSVWMVTARKWDVYR